MQDTHKKIFSPEIYKQLFDCMNKRRLILETPFGGKNTISYGLIVYAKDTRRWLITRRKHSVEFLLYIKGLYRTTHLPFLISCITKNEADIIKRMHNDDNYYYSFCNRELELAADSLQYSKTRFDESKDLVLELISTLDLTSNTLKWTWPKGRLWYSNNIKETPFECAKREFAEEVEINLSNPLYLSDNYVSESIKTFTGRTIEARYWIYVVPNEIPLTEPKDHPEVSKRRWATFDECSNLLQHADLFYHVADAVSSIHK